MAKRGFIEIDNFSVNLNTVVKNLAKEIGCQLYEAYENAIENFYLDYSPNKYERTESLLKGVIGVGGRDIFHKRIGKNYYSCGIYVGEEYIPGDPYINQHHSKRMSDVVNKEWVFPRAFDKGIHGYTIAELNNLNKDRGKGSRYYWPKIKKMRPTPVRQIITDYKSINRSVMDRLYSAVNEAANRM